MTPIRLGTRSSQLALWQAHHVKDLLSRVTSRPVELILIETHGDLDQKSKLANMGGFGVFTKAIQDALLDSRADVAVHSLKDLPTIPVPALTLGGVPKRGSTGDAFLSHKYRRFDDLPPGAVVGTSSLRRRSQILNRRPDLDLTDLRGNVETRLRKLREQNLDGIVLAQAGLERLGLDGEITELLDPEWMLPAVGQGAIGLECRVADADLVVILQQVTDPATHHAVLAERSMLFALGGGCLVPIGASTSVTGNELRLRGSVLSADGKRKVSATHTGKATDAIRLGEEAAKLLMDGGAGKILSESI